MSLSKLSPADYHTQELKKHCRTCGKRLGRGARQQNKHDITDLITACYKTDLNEDSDAIHPPQVCYLCVSVMRKVKKAQGTAFIRTETSLFQWTPHTASTCSMCEHFQATARGGRPKKQQPLGRQSGEPSSRTLEALDDAAGPTLVSGISPSRLALSCFQEEHIVCILCQAIVDSPVQLSCTHLACSSCIRQHILNNGQICPGCANVLDSDHFTRCTPLVLTVIAHLRIHCKFECNFPVHLKNLLEHESTCSQLSHRQLPRGSLSDVTVGELMNVPLTEPLSTDEEAVCSRLVRRSAQDGTLVITTGGQVHWRANFAYK